MIFSYLSESDIVYQYNQFYGYESSCNLSEKRVCSFQDSKTLIQYFVIFNNEGFSDYFWVFNNLGLNQLKEFKIGDLDYQFQKIILDSNQFEYNYVYFLLEKEGFDINLSINFYTTKGKKTKTVYICNKNAYYLKTGCELLVATNYITFNYPKKILIKFDLERGENIHLIDDGQDLQIYDEIKPNQFFSTLFSFNKQLIFKNSLIYSIGSKFILELKSIDINLHDYNIEADYNIIDCDNIDNNIKKCQYKMPFENYYLNKYTYFKILKDNYEITENEKLYFNLQFKYYNSSSILSKIFFVIFSIIDLSILFFSFCKLKSAHINKKMHKKEFKNKINELNSELLPYDINSENEYQISDKFLNKMYFMNNFELNKKKNDNNSPIYICCYFCCIVPLVLILLIVIILRDFSSDPLGKYVIMMVILMFYLLGVLLQIYNVEIYGIKNNLSINKLKQFLKEISKIHPIIEYNNRRLIYEKIYDISGPFNIDYYDNTFIQFTLNIYTNKKFGKDLDIFYEECPTLSLSDNYLVLNNCKCSNLFFLFFLCGCCYKRKEKTFIVKKLVEFEDSPLSNNEIKEIKRFGLKFDYF